MWTEDPYADFFRVAGFARRGFRAEGKAAYAVLAAKMETAKTGFGPGPLGQRTGARDAQSKRSKAFLSLVRSSADQERPTPKSGH